MTGTTVIIFIEFINDKHYNNLQRYIMSKLPISSNH